MTIVAKETKQLNYMKKFYLNWILLEQEVLHLKAMNTKLRETDAEITNETKDIYNFSSTNNDLNVSTWSAERIVDIKTYANSLGINPPTNVLNTRNLQKTGAKKEEVFGISEEAKILPQSVVYGFI